MRRRVVEATAGAYRVTYEEPDGDAPAEASDRGARLGDWAGRVRGGSWLGFGLAAALVLVLNLLVWPPLSWVWGIINGFLGSFLPTTCIQYQVNTVEMDVCSAWIGLLTILAPLAFIVVLFIYRRKLVRFVKAQASKAPEEMRFLVAPLVATLLFAVAWAGIHHSIGGRVGLVAHRYFPTLVGLFAYATTAFGGWMHGGMGGFLDVRDRVNAKVRLLLALAVPLIISILITRQTRVTQSALKEQFVVLIALVLGWILLAPRKDKTGKPSAAAPAAGGTA